MLQPSGTNGPAQTPLSTDERNMVRSELQAIVRSRHFRSSKRYPAFLTYIVEKTLNEEAFELKERTIGIDVFDRPADYDTNGDPIVRNTASEVRRRLSLYHAEAPADQLVSIHLPPGSYRPELHFVAHSSSTANVSNHAELSLPVVANPFERASQRRHFRGLLWTAAMLLLLLGGSLWWVIRDFQKSPADKLWSGILDSPETVLIVVPQAPGLVTGPLDNKLLAKWNQDNPDIAAEDLHAMMGVMKPLVDHKVRYQIQIDSTVTLTDLRNRPVVLIGGPSNGWAVKLLAPLRFHFKKGDGGVGVEVEDSQNPSSRQWGIVTSNYRVVEDCAIFARYHDPTTGGIVMVLAGAGRNGTEAAGEFVGSKTLLDELNRRLPSGWNKRNLEVILKTTVIDGKTGSPSIVATHLW